MKSGFWLSAKIGLVTLNSFQALKNPHLDSQILTPIISKNHKNYK